MVHEVERSDREQMVGAIRGTYLAVIIVSQKHILLSFQQQDKVVIGLSMVPLRRDHSKSRAINTDSQR